VPLPKTSETFDSFREDVAGLGVIADPTAYCPKDNGPVLDQGYRHTYRQMRLLTGGTKVEATSKPFKATPQPDRSRQKSDPEIF
jgi:hypothetical protein